MSKKIDDNIRDYLDRASQIVRSNFNAGPDANRTMLAIAKMIQTETHDNKKSDLTLAALTKLGTALTKQSAEAPTHQEMLNNINNQKQNANKKV